MRYYKDFKGSVYSC